MAQSTINKRNLEVLRSALDKVATNDLATLNVWIALGERAIRQNIDSGEWVRALKEHGGCPGHVTFKTVQNNIVSIVNLIRFFGSSDAACRAIDEHNTNAKKNGKKKSLNPQSLERLLIKGSKPAAKKTAARKTASLNDAVKQGIITAAQAKALKAMGF